MTTKERDTLAKGPVPRIDPPKRGDRCPRCHRRAPKETKCALCNPEGPR